MAWMPTLPQSMVAQLQGPLSSVPQPTAPTNTQYNMPSFDMAQFNAVMGGTGNLPSVSPIALNKGRLTMPILPSLQSTMPTPAPVSPVARTNNMVAGTYASPTVGTSSGTERAATKDVLDSLPDYDRFDDWSAAVGFGMKNVASLGMFGLDPLSIASVAKDISQGHGFASNYDQAMTGLGLDFDTVQKGMAFSKGVDLRDTTRGEDVGGNYGPSSMPNSITDPGAMSAAALGSYARDMNRAAAQSAAANDMGGTGYGGPSGMANSVNDRGALSAEGLRDSYNNSQTSAATGSVGGWGGGYTSESPGTSGGGGGADGNNGAGTW